MIGVVLALVAVVLSFVVGLLVARRPADGAFPAADEAVREGEDAARQVQDRASAEAKERQEKHHERVSEIEGSYEGLDSGDIASYLRNVLDLIRKRG